MKKINIILTIFLILYLIGTYVYYQHKDDEMDFRSQIKQKIDLEYIYELIKVNSGFINQYVDIMAEVATQSSSLEKNKQNKPTFFSPTADSKNIKVNDMLDFNYKTKEEIYKIRKDFVKKSLFNFKDYEPREYVFGQIESGKKWSSIANEITLGKYIKDEDRHIGLSEESRFINNPSALLMITNRFFDIYNTKSLDKTLYMLPSKINYNKVTNTMSIYYDFKNSFSLIINKNNKNFNLCSLNARDFNYNWIYIAETKNVSFNDISAKTHCVALKSFIHLGYATKVVGGANNGSPDDEELAFSIDNLPAYINCKLWNDNSSYKEKDADIYVNIILEDK